MAQLQPREEHRTKVQTEAVPDSHPPSPLPPGPPTSTAQLYPPVMVTASRHLPVADPWDVGLVWGRSVKSESGLGWSW